MSESIKVLFCAYDAPNYINGPNVWLQRMLPELQLRGVECKVLFLLARDPASCQTVQALRHAGIPCEVYAGQEFTEQRIRWILRQVDRERPDVFIPNLVVPAYFASRWIKQAGIPTVGVLHSDDPFYRGLLDQFVLRPAHDCLSAVVGVSKYLESLCRESAGPDMAVRMIPYGVPLPAEPASRPGKRLSLVYAGRLVERQKRICDLSRALCRVANELPGTEAVLYGSGPAEGDVRGIIEAAGCGNKVRLGGLLGHRELQENMLGGHVFVLLSEYEGLPIALLESMACGLVPICHRMRSGIPELVQDGVTGLVTDDRGDGFVAAVRRLREEDGLWERLSSAARERVAHEYSLKVCVEGWLALFKELRAARPMPWRPIVSRGGLGLPPHHPGIGTSEDRRWPGLLRYSWNRGRSLLRGKIRR